MQNEKPFVKIELLSNYIECVEDQPCFAHDGDAGIDLRNCGPHIMMDDRGVGTYKIPTGIKLEIPRGWCGIVLERSGLGFKYGSTIHGRVIDSGYRGEVCVLMSCKTSKFIDRGERVAQIVFIPYLDRVSIVKELDMNTTRRENGFGSTGEK